MDEQWLILVVEDDEATRAFLAENLAADGFRVASASSAAEGLRAIEVRRPSLVLLDLARRAKLRTRSAPATRPVSTITGRSGSIRDARPSDERTRSSRSSPLPASSGPARPG
jgi:DNA-binding response OmpR family regulator